MNCIRLRPNWMHEDRHIIGDLPLHALMLPGTHNSGMYDLNFEVRQTSLKINFLVEFLDGVYTNDKKQ